ncbi:MAG: nucleoside triphosphate pyrophosphohydrolase [Deltaproteobacteria bacterium]|nr:nucleoside triphosphate pyrophosphohydrolase [Deltaproteobacteria bacterium]
MPTAAEAFQKLVKIVARLRDPGGGCPWDLEQTHQSLKPCLVEETYELLDAIDESPERMREELGDVLLQVVLHSQIAADQGNFKIEDVISDICAKLIRRHPHVFADQKVEGTQEVLVNWEKIKSVEKKTKRGHLDGLPRSMPALARSQRIGERCARVGFDWPDLPGVRDKVQEELSEFLERLDEPAQPDLIKEEFGDLLFTLVQLARKLDFNAEEVLARACQKFTRRFGELESKASATLEQMTLEQMHKIWDQIKAEEK